ncbi:MAG: hypothetical protein RI952_1687 [Bacteroidota bacterium]|jgi:ATP-dependent Zn protease
MSFNKFGFLVIIVVIFFTSSVNHAYSTNYKSYRHKITGSEFYNDEQKSFQSKIDSLEDRTEELEDQKSILLIEMGNRKHKIEKLRSDSANHIVQLNLENSRSESLSESLKYLFIIILFFVLFVLIQFGIIFYAIKRITSQPVSQSNNNRNVIGQVHSNPQLESLEMLKNKGFISEEEYFRQRQSLMARQA